jgi:hypothetical protein
MCSGGVAKATDRLYKALPEIAAIFQAKKKSAELG